MLTYLTIQSRYKQKLKQAAKIQALKAKEQARVSREVVKVGMLAL